MKLALAGDTMLGRGVAEALLAGSVSVLADEVVAAAAEADLFILNLECCISERGKPWPAPGKPFFFRAPPRAAEVLAAAGVDCVTLANNHALDFGEVALLDTFAHLEAAGIRWAGAGLNLEQARAPARLQVSSQKLSVISFADHPRDFAASEARPGISHVELHQGVPGWLLAEVGQESAQETLLLSPHWGPNMTSEPPSYLRRAADQLQGAGAALVAGHSAHVFHGAAPGILYDTGDFLDDYAVDRVLRNDLGLLFLVTVDQGRATGLEALPLKLEYCHTLLARGEEATWVGRRFKAACARLGTTVEEAGGRLVIGWG